MVFVDDDSFAIKIKNEKIEKVIIIIQNIILEIGTLESKIDKIIDSINLKPKKYGQL